MTSSAGTVSLWNDEEGWGALDSPDTPGGCWFHFSSVAAGGRLLAVGRDVSFTFERVDQDGYHYRVVEVWPAGEEPDRSHRVVVEGPSAGYHSRLTLWFDEPADDEH